MTCGECGAAITGSKKKKYIKSTGEIKYYTFYHCTKRKKGTCCTQNKFISEAELEIQIDNELSKVEILPEFRDWALEALRKNNNQEVEERMQIHKNINTTLIKTQTELDNLTKMRIRDLLTDEEYLNQKQGLQEQMKKLREELRSTEDRADKWLEHTEQIFNFATYAREAFKNGDAKSKKEILLALGQNFILKDKKLNIQAHKWFQPIQKGYPILKARYLALEPTKTPMNKAQNKAFDLVRTEWRRLLDEVRTNMITLKNSAYIYPLDI